MHIKISIDWILLVICLFLCGMDCSSCPDGCDCTDRKMNCNLVDNSGQMVSDIPDDITHVGLHNWGCWNLTWNNVTHLELYDTRFLCSLPILQLSSLKSLRIYTFDFYVHFDILDLQSQIGLKELQFIGNKNLSFKNITDLLDGSRFLDLEVLVIDRISSRNDDPILTASSDFFETLSRKPELRQLEITNLNLNELDILGSKCPPRLSYLSLKGSIINKVKTYYDDTQTHVCDSLNTLDLSEASFRAIRDWFLVFPIFFTNKYLTGRDIKLYLFKYFFNVETILINNLNTYPLIVPSITLDMTAFQTKFKRINLSHNSIKNMNGSMISAIQNGVEEYNLSSNTLEFFSPRLLQPGHFLKKFMLDSNNLYKMQQDYWSDFEVVFHSYVNLEYLDLSNNGLTAIPENMFIHNGRLIHLDLGNNQLTSISFSLTKCVSLMHLNLQKNRLIFMDERDLLPLKNLLSVRSLVPNTYNQSRNLSDKQTIVNNTLMVRVNGNSFTCTCDNLNLQRWMVENNYIFDLSNLSMTQDYLCTFNGNEYNIITDDVEQIREYCDHQVRVRLSLIWSGTGFGTIVLCCLLGLIVRRQMIRRRQLRTLLRNLQNDDLPLEYLIFLSHCSADDELVINYVMPSLSETMQKVIGAKRDYICSGDKHFRPGHTIVEEVMRSVEKSAVVILVISNKYIQSPWCDMEAKEAATQQKPVILILTETIDESEMSSVLKQMFNRYTRFKCRTNDNGQHEVTPSWEMLCSSVLDLASVTKEA